MTTSRLVSDPRLAACERWEEDLHGYQRQAEQFLAETPFSLLLMDGGLGKTATILTLIARLLADLDRDPADKILIIAPLKVAVNVWPDEFRNWSHTYWIPFTLLRENDADPRIKHARDAMRARVRRELTDKGYSPKYITAAAGTLAGAAETRMRHRIRRELTRSPAPVHIINRERVEWLCDLYQAAWPYRTVIIDESHSFQDHNSNRFDRLKKIRNDPSLITRLHEMSATPASESYMQFFAQLYLIDKGERLGKNITKFRDHYFNFNKYTHRYKLREGADVTMLDKIKDVTLVMKAKDYLPRDEPTIYPVKIHLPDDIMAQYREMERDLVLRLPDKVDENGEPVEIEAITAAALATKLLQLASGAIYETRLVEREDDSGVFDKNRLVHEIHDEKVEMLREMVDEMQGRQLLVGYHFNSSLAKLKKAFPKATVMDRAGDAKVPWNKRTLKYPMMLIHPESGGEGLNLQKGGSNLVYFDIPNSLRQFIQLNLRLDRQGQTDPVVIRLLVAAGTRDEDAWAALKAKENVQEAMHRMLNALIRKYRSERDSLSV